jgi:hypothetical protein
MSKIRTIVFVAVTLLCVVSCFKEKSLEHSGNTPGTGGGGGGTGGGGSVNTYGFSLKDGSGTEHKGCVDTAVITNAFGVNALSIEFTDTDGHIFTIIYATTGTINTGTYTQQQGALLTMIDANGTAAYSSTSFSLKITAISATEVTAEFSGTMTNQLGGGTFVVTNGSIKAKIGTTTPC